ncbi:M48 family metalloprotease [Thermopolyspora sp. NPDC052614]|uniref:M48 family metalloprotease n=1 Tax=Thermopolyspora sp. NPDC052614 TaxID=3155682 RepID=UPI00341DC741
MPPSTASRKRSTVTFEEFGRRVFQDTLPRRYAGLYLLPALMTAVGAVVGLLLGGLPYGSLIGTGVLITGYLVTRRRGRPGFDPASVTTYAQRLQAETPSTAMEILEEAVAECKAHGYAVDLYRITCTCGRTRQCVCEGRVRAAVAPFGKDYAILAVGDRLDAPAELRFVLAHEVGHLVGRPHRLSQNGWAAANSLGFAVIGLHADGLALITGFVAWRCFCSLWYAINEIGCDIRAARRHGAGARAYWNRRIDQARRLRSAMSAWARLLALPMRILPMHPPFRMRAWYCRALGGGHGQA